MNWHTEAPPHVKGFIYAQIFTPCEEKGYWFLPLFWSKQAIWNDDTEQYDDCWMSINEFPFYDNEIFAWVPLSEIDKDCNETCQLDIKQLIKERNL